MIDICHHRNKEIEEYTSTAIENIGQDVTIEDILTDIAQGNSDHSGYSAIVCAVHTKEISEVF